MILSGQEIKRRLGTDIKIDPFCDSQLNPNSYNLRLHNELLVYEEVVLDVKASNRYRRLEIPPVGLVMSPSQIYLARTVERTETHNLVPMIEGRSSLGRLGLFVHVTAGFGDAGFCGFWTLEMFAVQPIRIYPNVQICQIIYHTLEGQVDEYHSKYQNNTDIQPSLLYKEFDVPTEDPQLKVAILDVVLVKDHSLLPPQGTSHWGDDSTAMIVNSIPKVPSERSLGSLDKNYESLQLPRN